MKMEDRLADLEKRLGDLERKTERDSKDIWEFLASLSKEVKHGQYKK